MTLFTYEDLIDYAATGYFGTHYERLLVGLGGGEGEYTVYWPKDSVRVIEGASYAVARAIACLLRDERTYWMGEPTSLHRAEISLPRRELSGSFADDRQARSGHIYAKDRVLSWDISTRGEDRDEHWAQASHEPLVFDFSTLPD